MPNNARRNAPRGNNSGNNNNSGPANAQSVDDLTAMLRTVAEKLQTEGAGSKSTINSTVHMPEFKGTTGEDGDQFIDQFAAIANCNRWSETARRAQFLARVRDAAYNWFKSTVHDKPDPPAFAEWSAAFKAKFGRDNEMRRVEAHIELQALRQDAKTVDEYSRRFEDATLRYNPSMDDRDKILAYAKGLRPTLTMEVLRANPTTYEQARQTAKLHENVELQAKALQTPTPETALVSVVSALSDRLARLDDNRAATRPDDGGRGDDRQGGYRRWEETRQPWGNRPTGPDRWQNQGGWRGPVNGDRWRDERQGSNFRGRGNGDGWERRGAPGPCPLCGRKGHGPHDCWDFEVRPRKRKFEHKGAGDASSRKVVLDQARQVTMVAEEPRQAEN